MSKNLYIDLHVIQTLPPSCVNRDDTGSPKTAIYGGVTRARVSSQSWKRAMRLMFADMYTEKEKGIRTKKIVDLLAKKISELDSEIQSTEKLAKKVLEAAGIKLTEKNGKVETGALFFISAKQIEKLAEKAIAHPDGKFEKEDKKITEQIKRLKYQQQFIRGRKEKMKGIWSIDFEHVFRKQFPNRYYIYEEIRDETDAGILKKTNEFITEFERRNYQMDYEIGYIQNENDILSGVYDNYTNAVILPFKKPKGMDYQILKAGEYLTGYHKGHWNTIGAAYERLLEYARCRQIKIDHIFLETYAVNNLMAESIEDYVTEIGVRIIS